MKLTSKPSSYSYFELLDACREPACPVCRLGEASANRHLTNLIYDGVNDIPSRALLRDSYGYCHEHAWLLPEAGESAPLGIAIIHRDVLNTLRKQLDETQFDQEQQGSSLRSLISQRLNPPTMPAAATARYLPATAVCPACTQRSEAEQLALSSLLEALDKHDQAMQDALGASDGLCLAHLRAAFEQARKPATFELLLAITKAQLAALINDLDEFIRKNDHRFRGEKITLVEAESWRRALERVSGKAID